jgi:hypothetical protein
MRRQLITALLGHTVVGSKCTVVRGCCGEANGLTEVISAGTTVTAGIASAARFQDHTVAYGEALNTIAAFDHYSGRLMSENDRLLDDIPSYRAMLPIMYLCAEKPC